MIVVCCTDRVGTIDWDLIARLQGVMAEEG